MCKPIIDAADMLTLALTGNRDALSFRELRKVRDDLCDRGLGVEWTRVAVLGAVELFPDVFRREGDSVAWCGEDKGAVRRGVTEWLPGDTGDRLASLVDKVVEALAPSLETKPRASIEHIPDTCHVVYNEGDRAALSSPKGGKIYMGVEEFGRLVNGYEWDNTWMEWLDTPLKEATEQDVTCFLDDLYSPLPVEPENIPGMVAAIKGSGKEWLAAVSLAPADKRARDLFRLLVDEGIVQIIN